MNHRTYNITRRSVIVGAAATAAAASGVIRPLNAQTNGLDSTAYNPKIDNVETALNAIPEESGTSVKYSGEPLPGTMVESHVQGIGKWGDYYVLTHNNKGYSKGKILIMNRTSKDMVQDIPTPIEHYNHPGGIQVIGDFAVVAIETSDYKKSRMVFYDFSGMSDDTAPSVHPFEIQSDNRGAGAAGICNYTDGGAEYYVVAAYSGKKVKFYRSNDRSLHEDDCSFTELFDTNISEDGYQSVNLLTQTDNQIYMVGMRTEGLTSGYADYMDLYSVDLSGGSISERISARHVKIQHNGGAIDGQAGSHFRWAGGIGVVSSTALEAYAGQRNFVGGHYYLNEFAT